MAKYDILTVKYLSKIHATFWVEGHLTNGDPAKLYWYEKDDSTFVCVDCPWVYFL